MTEDGFCRERDEVEHVDGECPDCEATLIGMTPDDVRQHIVEDHGDPLGRVCCWPTDEARRRLDPSKSENDE